MNMPRRSTVGARRMAASMRSLSRKRVIPDGLVVWRRGRATAVVALPAPPEIGCFMSLPVDFLELAGRPLHGVLGLARNTLGEHVHDDVLAVDLGRLRRRRPGEPDDPRVVGRGL